MRRGRGSCARRRPRKGRRHTVTAQSAFTESDMDDLYHHLSVRFTDFGIGSSTGCVERMRPLAAPWGQSINQNVARCNDMPRFTNRQTANN